jgi:uncharacterized protein (TIGR03435 family)
VTLKTLITTAYHLRDSQISDGPGWIDSDRYDVNAKAKNGDVSLQEALQMLQTLLTDRFKLVFHRETKDVAAYTLLSGKNPPKLTPALANGESGIKVLPIEGQKSVVQMVGRNMTMQHLVDILGNQLRVPVIDHTGLTGSFDFDVKLDARDSSPGTSPDLGPLIVTAIQEQLGLKLESTKVPGEFLVIESVERPTLN